MNECESKTLKKRMRGVCVCVGGGTQRGRDSNSKIMRANYWIQA